MVATRPACPATNVRRVIIRRLPLDQRYWSTALGGSCAERYPARRLRRATENSNFSQRGNLVFRIAGLAQNLIGMFADARRLTFETQSLATLAELDRQCRDANERSATEPRYRRREKVTMSQQMRVIR